MNVEVLLFGRLRELATRQLVVPLTEGARLVDLINWLSKEYGADFRQEINRTKRYNILINGRYYHLLDDMETPLKEGDVVAMLPPWAGG